jgi:hypothetical protein
LKERFQNAQKEDEREDRAQASFLQSSPAC